MKLVLDREEFLELVIEALKLQGFTNVNGVSLDLGDDTVLPIDTVKGLIVEIGR